MDEVTYIKTRFRKEQWEKLIADCQSSGLKVDEWCEENHVSRHAYYYWLRKIRRKACESLLPIIPRQNTSVDFAKVEVKTHQPDATASVIIHLPFATLEVPEGTSQKTIETVVLALKSIC